MIERLFITAGLLIAATLAGYAVRALGGARSRRRASTVTLEAAPDGAARLLIFSSRWCSDCAAQHEVIERSRPSWPRPVAVSYHDAVKESELAHRLGIVLVPALVVADPAGRVVDVRQGLVDADRLRTLIVVAA